MNGSYAFTSFSNQALWTFLPFLHIVGTFVPSIKCRYNWCSNSKGHLRISQRCQQL